MAKTDSSSYDLTETEKRDLIKLIEQGKPLPEKYRFLLFADKREVELVWNGKSREVCTAILPFQTLEHIDEPRKETRPGAPISKSARAGAAGQAGLETGAPAETLDQPDLLDLSGRQIKGWTGAYIFENEWQSFRTRQSRELEMTTASHTYAKPGRYIIAVKVIDIFGNDTMSLVPVTVG